MPKKFKGRGWHGDSEGHSKAGKKSSGKFTVGDPRTKDAGRKGGLAAQKSGNAHKLTAKERAKGGAQSRVGENESVFI